jgi:signal peptidase I
VDKLKKQFLSIKEQLSDKKPFFERKIERWKRRDRESWYKQASRLLEEALVCEQEIISVFDSSDWKHNKPFLKVKINTLEGLFKELATLTRSSWLKMIEVTVVVCVIVFVLRTFIFGIYHVPTSSAEPTLLVGDRVWGNKLTYVFTDPKPGDMVMFQDPGFACKVISEVISEVIPEVIPDDAKQNFWVRIKNYLSCWWQRYIGIEIALLGLLGGPRNMAKRVVAGPGDVIEGKIESGKPAVYRNGKKLRELYVNRYSLLAMKKLVGFFEREKIAGIKIPKFLRARKKIVLYSYDPKKDFEDQPFYYIDYRDVLYDRKTGYMKIYKSQVPSESKQGKVIDTFGPYMIPEGKYWVMGDNRRNSVDSREWGVVDRKKISGKASFIIWSLDSEEPVWFFEFIKNPFRFFSLLRWDRFFKKVE